MLFPVMLLSMSGTFCISDGKPLRALSDNEQLTMACMSKVHYQCSIFTYVHHSVYVFIHLCLYVHVYVTFSISLELCV